MRKEIKLRLGKKDKLLKYWWEEMSSSGENISHTIKHVIEYYVQTGEYITIAVLKEDNDDNNSEDILRKIYLQEESDAYKWLLEKQEKGEKISAVVKRILRGSIETGQKTTLKSLDEIAKLSENVNKTYIPKQEIKAPIVVESPEKPSEKSPPSIEVDEDEAPQIVTFPFDKQEETPDLMDKLLGENTLSL